MTLIKRIPVVGPLLTAATALGWSVVNGFKGEDVHELYQKDLFRYIKLTVAEFRDRDPERQMAAALIREDVVLAGLFALRRMYYEVGYEPTIVDPNHKGYVDLAFQVVGHGRYPPKELMARCQGFAKEEWLKQVREWHTQGFAAADLPRSPLEVVAALTVKAAHDPTLTAMPIWPRDVSMYFGHMFGPESPLTTVEAWAVRVQFKLELWQQRDLTEAKEYFSLSDGKRAATLESALKKLREHYQERWRPLVTIVERRLPPFDRLH